MKSFLVIFSLFCVFNCSHLLGQSFVYPKNLQKKCLKKFQEGQELQKKGDYAKAVKAYDQVLKKNPELHAATIQKARLQYDLGNKEGAKELFAQSVGQYPSYSVKSSKAYAALLIELEEYDEAERMLAILHQEEPDNEILEERFTRIQRLNQAISNPVSYELTPLSTLVNTNDSEYEISFTLDESTMIFTRRYNGQEDLFEASIVDGNIVKVEPIEELNTPLNEGAHTISSDGHTLIFTFCDDRRTYGGCDLYISKNNEGDWSRPENLGQQFNTEYRETQPSLSGDGNTLYFTSNRPGGKGGNDIWFSTVRPDGVWTKPINMGSTINSQGNDETPFIHTDGLSLYLASDGRDGFGKLDLYKATRNAWGTKWQSVEHLPYPINTINNDRGLKVSRNGTTAYISTDRETQKKLDIYSFELPKAYQPIKANTITLIVKDNITKEPLQANLVLSSQTDTVHQLKTTADTEGRAIIPYVDGEAFSAHVMHDGYIFHSETISAEDGDINYEIYLQPVDKEIIKKDEAIVLKNIFFETGSATLEDRSKTEIQFLYDLLEQQALLRIRIVGHTDSVGSDADNNRLSTARAKAVYEQLIAKGIAPDRLQYEGKGESEPVASNDTAEGREQNRRTEFYIL